MLNVLSFANVDHYFEDTFGAPFRLVVGFVGDEMAAGAEIRSGALISSEWTTRDGIIIYATQLEETKNSRECYNFQQTSDGITYVGLCDGDDPHVVGEDWFLPGGLYALMPAFDGVDLGVGTKVNRRRFASCLEKGKQGFLRNMILMELWHLRSERHKQQDVKKSDQ